jgi:hypothetical protein
LNALSDDTAFMATFQLERADGAYVFDGYDSGNTSQNTLIKGNAIWKDQDNTYLYPLTDASGATIYTKNTLAPQLWLCVDTYCVVGQERFKYVSKGSPDGSQANY